MSETEKVLGRQLAEAVNRIPNAAGQKYFLGFVEGAAAMAAELTATTLAAKSRDEPNSVQESMCKENQNEN